MYIYIYIPCFRAIRKLLAIPFLPAEQMYEAFLVQKSKVQKNASMSMLCAYIEKNWFRCETFRPEVWSVYGRAIRTNNMVEGWHNRLIVRAGQPNLNLYRLIALLFQEAGMTRLHHNLASQGKVVRKQKRQNREKTGQIMATWEQYAEGKLTSGKLLKKISQIYSPGL